MEGAFCSIFRLFRDFLAFGSQWGTTKAYLLCGVCLGSCAVRPGSQRGRKYPRNSSWLPSTIKQVWTGVGWGGAGWGVGLGCESWPIMSALVTVDIGPAELSEMTCPTSLLLPLNINQAVLRSAGFLSAQVWQ